MREQLETVSVHLGRLNENHEVVPCTIKELTETFDNFEFSRRVARTYFDSIEVSTVFLAIDHGWFGKPLWFETMIFGSEHPKLAEYQERYETWDEAIEGHKRAVELVKSVLEMK